MFDIKKFFRSLRVVAVPLISFSSKPPPNPSWIFYRDRSILFGDSASGDYAACAKAATVLTDLHNVPSTLQDTVRQALLNDTYVDDGGFGADSPELLSELLDKIEKY